VVGVNPHGDLAYLAGLDGTLKGSTTYTPWGEKRSQSGEGADLGFQGDFTDADTGMVDMGARLYAPDLGRFTTTDPVAGDPSTPASMNEYIYGWVDPLSLTDPTGEAPLKSGQVRSGGTGDNEVIDHQHRQDDLWNVRQQFPYETAEIRLNASIAHSIYNWTGWEEVLWGARAVIALDSAVLCIAGGGAPCAILGPAGGAANAVSEGIEDPSKVTPRWIGSEALRILVFSQGGRFIDEAAQGIHGLWKLAFRTYWQFPSLLCEFQCK
jgi:RHS repeat-associated protein